MSVSVLDPAGHEKVTGNNPWTVVDSTATGTQNNWAPGINGNTLITWHGASDITVTGFAAGVLGQILTIKNTGTKIGFFAHQSGSSSAGNKLRHIITSGVTPIAPRGYISYQYDGTDWQLIDHQQGAAITVPYDAALFTAASGTWTVDSGDIGSFSYYVRGGKCLFTVQIGSSSVSGTPATLRVTMPNGYTCSVYQITPYFYSDNGAAFAMGVVETTSAPTKLYLYAGNYGTVNFSVSTNATGVGLVCEVSLD